MTTNPFGGGTGTRSPFPTAGKVASKPHGVSGLFENLGSDITNAVTGFLPGTIHLAEHPIGGIEQMAHSTWQTWSPLFHGKFSKFASGVYTHPLAPLLDAATVFDFGLGAAGKLGKVAHASDTSLLGKAAKLTEPKTAMLQDALKGRHEVPFQYSTRPLRRLTQEHILPHVGAGLGKIDTRIPAVLGQAKYEKAFFSDMAHRAAAKSVMMTTAMLAGKALTDPNTAPRARTEIAAGLVLNLHRHAPVELSPADAVSFLQKNKHYIPLLDPSQIDRGATRHLRSLLSKEARWEKHRALNAPAAHSLPSIRNELDQQNGILKEMHDKGYLLTSPAKTKLKEPTARQQMEANAVPVKEIEGNVKRLTQQLSKAHDARKIHDRAVQELSLLKAQRMDLQQRSFADYFHHVGSSDAEFEKFVTNLGKYATASIGSGSKKMIEKAVGRAARTSSGNIRLVPKHDPTMLGHEAANSSRFVKWLYRKPTALWKTIQVGFTPRTVTNNGVGNYVISALRQGPISTIYGVYTAHKILHGDARAGEILMHATPFKRNHWMFRHFSTELNNVFGHELLNGNGGRISSIKGGFYPLVHTIADEPIRMGAITHYMRNAPEVKALMQHENITFDQAASRALRADPHLQAGAANYARTIAGDYQTLRPWEKRIKDLAPFYMWDRHILKSTGNLVADTPGRAVLVQQLSQMGENQVQKILGDLPEFLRGAVPLSMLGLNSHPKGSDRADALLTTSLNPFNTVGDLARLGQSVTVGHTVNPGSDLFSQVNPLLTGTVEYGTGTNLLTGAPKQKHGGLVPSILSNLGQGFPEVKLVESALTPTTELTPKGKTKEFAVDHRSQITSLLGVPVRNISKSVAHAAADKENGKKKGRKSKSPFG